MPLSGRCTYTVNRRRGAEAEAEVGGGEGWKGRKAEEEVVTGVATAKRVGG